MIQIKTNLCKSHSDRRGMKPEYIVVHWVGAVSTAKNNADYFARVNPLASAHYFVDAKEIWKSVPEFRAAWSVGGGRQSSLGGRFYKKCTNSNSISIELCCIKINGRTVVDPLAIKRASDLVQRLMKKYKIPKNKVIRHFDVTGKHCPNGYLTWQKWSKMRNQLVGKEKIK